MFHLLNTWYLQFVSKLQATKASSVVCWSAALAYRLLNHFPLGKTVKTHIKDHLKYNLFYLTRGQVWNHFQFTSKAKTLSVVLHILWFFIPLWKIAVQVKDVTHWVTFSFLQFLCAACNQGWPLTAFHFQCHKAAKWMEIKHFETVIVAVEWSLNSYLRNTIRDCVNVFAACSPNQDQLFPSFSRLHRCFALGQTSLSCRCKSAHTGRSGSNSLITGHIDKLLTESCTKLSALQSLKGFVVRIHEFFENGHKLQHTFIFLFWIPERNNYTPFWMTGGTCCLIT